MCRTAECKEVTVNYVRPHGTRALSELFTRMHQKRYSTRENTFNFNVPTNNLLNLTETLLNLGLLSDTTRSWPYIHVLLNKCVIEHISPEFVSLLLE